MALSSDLTVSVTAVLRSSGLDNDRMDFGWVAEGCRVTKAWLSLGNISLLPKILLDPNTVRKADCDGLVAPDTSSCCMGLHPPWLRPRLQTHTHVYVVFQWARQP